MVFLTIFVLFAKLKAQFLDSLTKSLQKNANLCIQKSYWFCARALFQKFVSPHTNSSGGKGLKHLRQGFVAMNMMNNCAKFHKDSPSDKKVKLNLPSAIELSETAVFVYNFV